MPQLGSILPSSQAAPPATQPAASQHAARIVSHLAAGSLPQVRVVSSQSGLGSSVAGQQATLVHQTPHQIRVPVSVAAKGLSQVTKEKLHWIFFFFSVSVQKSVEEDGACCLHPQAVVSMPLRSQPVSTPVQVPTSLTVTAVAKPQTVSPSSPAHNPTSPAMLQGVSSQNIKQVCFSLTEITHR